MLGDWAHDRSKGCLEQGRPFFDVDLHLPGSCQLDARPRPPSGGEGEVGGP
jgi:hypothetical protein